MDIQKIKEIINNSVRSVIATLIFFSGAWYYLDQKRLDISNQSLEVSKIKLKNDLEREQIDNKTKELENKEKLIQNINEKQLRDKEMNDLTLKFINEVSDVDINLECQDDPIHNAKRKKAEALLLLIEAKAQEYNRTDILNTFVKPQQHGNGIYRIMSKCKN